MVGVGLHITLGDLDVVFGDDLVEGVGASTKELAGVTMAQNVRAFLELDLPFCLAAVALSVFDRHDSSNIELLNLRDCTLWSSDEERHTR